MDNGGAHSQSVAKYNCTAACESPCCSKLTLPAVSEVCELELDDVVSGSTPGSDCLAHCTDNTDEDGSTVVEVLPMIRKNDSSSIVKTTSVCDFDEHDLTECKPFSATKQEDDSCSDDDDIADPDFEPDITSPADSNRQCLSLFQKRERKPGCKQSYDKIHYCTFCGNQICSKISRHLLNVHVGEMAVKGILCMPKGSRQQRRTKLQRLTDEGNFKHNITVMQKGEGEIVVGKRTVDKSACDYTVCEFCKRFESKKNLWRHMKSCAARKEYYESPGQENAKRLLAVKWGNTLVSNAAFAGAGEHTKELFERMRDDDIKAIVMSDELICREADLRMAALRDKSDWKQDDIYRISHAARTLGRIVQCARLVIPNASLNKLIVPQCFDMMVDIAKKMSTEKQLPSLKVGRTIGCLLRKLSMSKYCVALRANNIQAEQAATSFKQLLDREWDDRVNQTAVRRMQTENQKTVPTIPLTEDLQKFRSYLLRHIDQVSCRLKMHPAPQDWVLLAKLVLSRLILFNKRRWAEVCELKVSAYLARPDWHNYNSDEMSLALSPVDRLLAERYEAVVSL